MQLGKIDSLDILIGHLRGVKDADFIMINTELLNKIRKELDAEERRLT